MADPVSLDGLLPPQVAAKAVEIGIKKGHLPFIQMFLLAILAGAFISMGAIFCTMASTGTATPLGFGGARLVGGFVFSLGLILVVVAGAELFTGNNLLVMAAASGKLPLSRLLWNWVVVYTANFIGSVLTAYIMYLTLQYTMAEGAVGVTAMKIANSKCSLEFVPALTRGIFCNALVCLAIWLCYSCRSTTDKILSIIFPITAFVAVGFEHSVANMYFIPAALFIKGEGAFWAGKIDMVRDCGWLTWENFFVRNLLPVTMGNIIGGAFFVGIIYWTVYILPTHKKER